MFIATFNNVSVFYHTSAVGRGVQDGHVESGMKHEHPEPPCLQQRCSRRLKHY
jgi:hypothetical protein